MYQLQLQITTLTMTRNSVLVVLACLLIACRHVDGAWQRVRGQDFYFSDEKLTQSQAMKKCWDMNAKLFEPTNAQMNLAVAQEFFKKYESEIIFWTGYRRASKDQPEWYGLSNPANGITWTNWFLNEPNNKGGDQLCIQSWKVMGTIGYWDDTECTSPMGYVCEKPILGKSNIIDTLLIVTGLPPGDETRETDAISLMGGGATVCSRPIGIFPISVTSSVGGVMGDIRRTLLLCGGFEVDACYYLEGSNSNEWKLAEAKLSDKRDLAAGIVIHSKYKTLWVTGGVNGNTLNSTDLVSLSEDQTTFSTKPGPKLPLPNYGHCMVKLNETTAMVLGGKDSADQYVPTTYFISIPKEGQTPAAVADVTWAPALRVGRWKHSCGLLTDPGDENRHVIVVTGGDNEEEELVSTELFVVGSAGWIPGPDLPQKADAARGVTSNDGKSFLVAGGDNDGTLSKSILKLEYNTNDNGYEWTKLEQEMKVARQAHVALLVPDAFC